MKERFIEKLFQNIDQTSSTMFYQYARIKTLLLFWQLSKAGNKNHMTIIRGNDQ